MAAKNAKKARDPIAQWKKSHDKWSDTLPKHRENFAPGQWRFAMTDAERLAAGWERAEGWASERDPAKIAAWKPKDAADLRRGPMRSLGMVNWVQHGPDPQRKAAAALADETDKLAIEVERRGKSSLPAIKFADKLRDHSEPGQFTVELADDVLRLLRELEFAAVAKNDKRGEAPGNLDEKRRRPVLPQHRDVHKVLLRDGGKHGLLLRDIKVKGAKGKTLQRRLDVLRENQLAELVKGTRRWRAIGQ